MRRTHLPVLAVLAAAAVLPATPADAATVTCAGLRATKVGTAGDDVITGTSGRDVIQARAGNDRVRGLGGNDVICGGDGRDELRGGTGDDRLLGGLDQIWEDPGHGTAKTGDTLYGGPGNDRLDAGRDTRPVGEVDQEDTLSWADSTAGVRVSVPDGTATGQGSDRFVAGPVLVLTRYADHVTGGSGPDEIWVGAGSDQVFAGGGDDHVELDDGPGTGGDDTARGGDGDDVIAAAAGTDSVAAGSGRDAIIDGSSGADRFWLGAGDDVLIDAPAASSGQLLDGGTGRDSWSLVDATALPGTWDMATGALTLGGAPAGSAPGWEEATLGTGGWQVTGTEAADTVYASSATTFWGLGGDDRFSGSLGDDVFDGGPGTDSSPTMQDGDDTCRAVETVPGDCEHVEP